MREVAVAWPNDDASADAVAARLRAAGITCRVDRGLWSAWQVPAPTAQLTVYVSERHASRAREVLGDAAPSASRAARRAALLPGCVGVLAVVGLVIATTCALTLAR